MARRSRLSKKKHEVFREICGQLQIPPVPEWFSAGSSVTTPAFEAVLSTLAQRTGIPPKGLSRHEDLAWRLVHKAADAFLLSIEVINKPTVGHRLEAFLMMLCNAWELALKARILIHEKSCMAIYYDYDQDRTLDLRKCARKCFGDKDPIRANIERVASLRDKATHLFLPTPPRQITGLLQASVLNLHTCLQQWFDCRLCDRVSSGMLLIMSLHPGEWEAGEIAVLKEHLTKDDFSFIARFCSEIDTEHALLNRPREFMIEIGYAVSLTKREDEGDIRLTAGPGGETTRIVEVPKNPDRTHPHRQKDVVDAFNKSDPVAISINRHDIQCVRRVHQIDKRPELCYRSKFSGSQFSDAFVAWLADQVTRDPAFFATARKRYAEMLKAGKMTAKSS